MPVNEDLTKTSFFSLLEDSSFLYQAKSPLKSHNNASVFKQIKQSTFIDNSMNLEKKDISDLEVNIGNYFDFNAAFKVLHYFEPSSKNLLLLDLKTIPIHNLKPENTEINLQQISLDINFTLPYNICSITTPDGRLFLCGGSDEGETYNALYEYNPKENTLVRKRSMLSKRCNHGICMLGRDKILVAGGFASEQGYLNTCEVYHIKKDTWSYVSSLNKKSECHSLCNFNDEYIYKLGGKKDYVIERYSIKTNNWQVILLDKEVEIGDSCETVQINSNQILIFGGYYQGNLDQCALLTVKADGDEIQETLSVRENLILPDRLYFHCPKSVVVYGESVYAIDYGKQKVVRFGNKQWKCLN